MQAFTAVTLVDAVVTIAVRVSSLILTKPMLLARAEVVPSLGLTESMLIMRVVIGGGALDMGSTAPVAAAGSAGSTGASDGAARDGNVKVLMSPELMSNSLLAQLYSWAGRL